MEVRLAISITYKFDRKNPALDEPYIKLDQFLKWVGAADTGGHAKVLIQEGQIQVNGETETRRGRKLRKGDQVQFQDQTWTAEPEQR
jgi:ribosome-associated protein